MANTLNNCRMGAMKISFGNMIVELNIFDIIKQPLEYDEVRHVCLIEEIIEETIYESNIEDPLEACLVQFGDDLDLDKLFEQTVAILKSALLESSEREKTTVPEPSRRNLSLYRTLLSVSS